MIAIIPARGGSKGVPQKNIKILDGKPLIAYTIEAAIESQIFEKIIVSTDDEDIAIVAEKYGAEIPFLRPDDISGDHSSSDDAIIHALNFYKAKGLFYEEVCKLQATSPLRTAAHIKRAYLLLKEKNADFVVSVCECEHSPLWSGVMTSDNRLDDFISESAKRACRQDLPSYFRLNGAIYMGKTEKFLENKSFLGCNTYGFVMSQEESVDIDSMLDFQFAELIIRNQIY